MRPGVLNTNILTDTQSPTEDNGLDSFMDIAVLVLLGHLIAFPYRQAAQRGKVQVTKCFGRTPFSAMDLRCSKGVFPYL